MLNKNKTATWVPEIGRLAVLGQLRKKKNHETPISMEKSWTWLHVCHSSYRGKIVVQASLGKKEAPISKTTRRKRIGSMVQARELLPSKCKALSSNTSTAKKSSKRGSGLLQLFLIFFLSLLVLKRHTFYF
jgi:hypothetical protein